MHRPVMDCWKFQIVLTAVVLMGSLASGSCEQCIVRPPLSHLLPVFKYPCTISCVASCPIDLVTDIFSPGSHEQLQQAVDSCYGSADAIRTLRLRSPSTAQSIYHDPKAGIIVFYGKQNQYGFLSNFYFTVRASSMRADTYPPLIYGIYTHPYIHAYVNTTHPYLSMFTDT